MKVTYTNPLVENGPDPFVTEWKGNYYYSFSTPDGVYVEKQARLCDFKRVGKHVYTPEEGTMWSREFWAPEIHEIDGEWYLYVAADDGQNANHRMYCLKSENGEPDGHYVMMGKVTDATDEWGIDGTILKTKDGIYMVWSGQEGFRPGVIETAQNIYIAKLKTPWEVDGPRVMLSTPEYDWETAGSSDTLPKVNEGPQILYKDDTVHIIYSAAGSWCQDYCLGRLTFRGGSVLDPACWEKGSEPVFSKTEGSYGPGHCSFVKAPDGTDMIFYHARRDGDGGWPGRGMRLQAFTWSGDVPVFGTPAEPGKELTVEV